MIKIMNVGQGAKGFQMTFANGWTVSVQFGAANYCDNRNYSGIDLKEKGACANAEIAAWDATGKWYDFGADEVKGRCDPDAVAQFIALIQSMPLGNPYR